MPNKIIIDFDHTLFNAQLFKKDLAKSLGLSLAAWEKDYQSNKNKFGNYNYKKQIAEFPKNRRQKFLKILKNSKKYLYKDAVLFLKSVGNAHVRSVQKNQIILLSKGQPSFQKIKIQKCVIKKYVTVKTVAKSKINFISHLKNKKDILFINDRGKEIDEIKKRFPAITAIWVRRANGQYKNEPCKKFDRKIHNLNIKL